MAIRALSEFEHIRLCPGNYIGGTETPTHLLYELIDNSADECITGNSKFLAVIMNYDDNKYTVVDKGRGIPLKSKEFKEDAPVIIATKLFTGGKFDNDLYQHRSGLHGEGLVIVNALSTAFEIITKNKDKHRQYTFNGQNVEIKDIEQKKYSTSVSFSPDPTYFDTVVIDKNVIEARLKSILVYNKEKDIEMILIIVKDDKITKIEIKDTIVQEFESDCDKFINTQISSKKDELSLYVGCSSENKTKKFKGIINTLNVDMGTHQKMIENILREYLYEKAVKNKMHVNKEDVFIGGRILAIMKITNPAFAGQTKYALNMKESTIDHIINKNSIIKFLDANTDFVDYWLNIAQSYRIEIDSKKQTKTRKSRNIIIVDDLKDCLSNDLEERELFLLEGQSAGGTLQLARDINIHAILPLRGKVLNVLNVDKKKVFNSKAIMNIFTAMNVKPFSEDLSGLRYGKTIILCFTGDTKVKMLNGKNKTFEELVEMEKRQPGREYLVYSMDANGEFVPGKAYAPRITSYVNELIHITIDNKFVIKCTPNHKFILRDGSEIEAKDLKEDMSLMPLYFKMFSEFNSDSIYEYIKSNNTGKYERTHRVMANKSNEMYSNLVCHHKDHNTLNNEPNNLQWMTEEEHNNYHLNIYNSLGIHGERISYLHKETDTYKHCTFNDSGYNFSEKNKETTCLLNKREDVKLLQKRGLIIRCVCKLIKENEEFNETNFNKWRGNGVPFYKNLLQYFNSYDEIYTIAIQNKYKYDLNEYKSKITYDKNKKARNSIARIVKKLLDNNLPIIGPYYEEHRTSKSDPKWNNILKYYQNMEELIEYAKTYNHKVTKVEYKKLDVSIPVYNLTVEKYHNYAILDEDEKQSILVKNCDGATRFHISKI